MKRFANIITITLFILTILIINNKSVEEVAANDILASAEGKENNI